MHTSVVLLIKYITQFNTIKCMYYFDYFEKNCHFNLIHNTILLNKIYMLNNYFLLNNFTIVELNSLICYIISYIFYITIYFIVCFNIPERL